METFTFYSYKGGTGRSLLLTNAARYLASLGKRVVAVDFDFEAPGLHYKMHIGRPGARTGDVVPELGVVDYLLAATAGRASAQLSSYITPVPLPRDTPGKLYLMPAGAAPSGEYWKALTTLLQEDFFSDPEGTGIAACLELKARIEDELKADFILIDSRTGITELAGLATTLLADKVVSLVINNRESLAGARAVMRSFGRAPRLKGQDPIELLTVLSRVPDGSEQTLSEVLRFLNAPGPTPEETLSLKKIFVLRVDPELATHEKLHVGGDEPAARSSLHQDYLALLAAMVTADRRLVSAAAQRHEAVAEMKRWLTDGHESHRHRRSSPDPFSEDQLDEGVQLGRHSKRYADLVVYGGGDRTKPLMAVEYVDDLKLSEAWKWWEQNTDLRCAVLLGKNEGESVRRRVFTRSKRRREFIERDDQAGWIVKWPASFSGLADPGDRSIGSMLKAVERGEDSFIGLLVTEWQHCSFVTLHGGAPYRPQLARQILDGLAQVTDPDTELRILWRTAPDPFERSDEGFGPEGGSLEDMTNRELHAPLWWRLSVQAKIELWSSRGHRRGRGGHPSAGLNLLVRDLMGLSLDQDREFRREVRQLTGSVAEGDEGEIGAYRFTSLFNERELTFELSDEASTELIRRVALDDLSSSPENSSRDSESVWNRAEHISKKALQDDRMLARLLRGAGNQFRIVTTNLLGAYDPNTCRVTLYTKVIDAAARLLGLETRALANVVFLHETIHAICHIGRDLDDRMWDDFGLPSSRSINFRPSLMHATLAQYFSFRLIERLGDSTLMSTFERLTENETSEYQGWGGIRNVSVEEVRRILLRARAGLDDVSWIDSTRQAHS